MADKAILWALISASTKEGRKACSLSYFACKAAEAELGLAYMAANDNKEFLTSLSNIMRYKIDAGLSESYTCYLLSKGKIIRPYLKNLNPLQLAADCIETVNKIKDKEISKVKKSRISFLPTMRKITTPGIIRWKIFLRIHLLKRQKR